jgi:tRNA (cmo5U34)-methyltransferase
MAIGSFTPTRTRRILLSAKPIPEEEMPEKKMGFFDEKAAAAYDERNSKSAPIMENLHFLLRLVLKDIPADASILCVGVGTGADILGLAKNFPGWRFTGVEPSAPMLEVCRRRLEANGLASRTDLFEGYLGEMPGEKKFDAVLCLLVTHFLKDDKDRQALFDQMASRLKPAGYLVNAEICYDQSREDYPEILEKWLNLHKHSGATEESLAQMPRIMRETLGVIAPEKTESMMKKSGFAQPIQFFQSILIRGWYARK